MILEIWWREVRSLNRIEQAAAKSMNDTVAGMQVGNLNIHQS
jgi:hypothetical protein